MIRLFVIEDHPIIVQGLKNIFRPKRDGIEIVGSAGSIKELIDKCDPDTLDIFTLDLWLGEENPVDNVRLLMAHFPNKPIVILTSEESQIWKRKMILAGVKGYIIKHATKSEFKMVFEKVMKGATFLSGTFRSKDNTILRDTLVYNDDPLPEKQRRIVSLLSEGLTHKEIAHQMGNCVSTIDKAASKLRIRFSAKTNAELIKILTEKGII